jgi:hypothetical protein
MTTVKGAETPFVDPIVASSLHRALPHPTDGSIPTTSASNHSAMYCCQLSVREPTSATSPGLSAK